MKKNSYLKPELQVIQIETEQIIAVSPTVPGPSEGDQGGAPGADIQANKNYSNTWNSKFEEE